MHNIFIKHAWRVGEPSMPKHRTALDVINYERRELGNELYIYLSTEQLARLSAHRLMWVTPTRALARQYHGTPYKVMFDRTVEVVARDNYNGHLVIVA